jgi:lactoylglutathione lyase
MDQMVDIGRLYHLAFVVPSLERAMAELGTAMNLTWAPVTSRSLTVRSDDGDAPASVEVTYSFEGPPHIELIEGVPKTPWSLSTVGRVHHIGLWVADLEAESARLEELGMRQQAAGVDALGEITGFSYHASPYGVSIELVDAARRPAFEAWMCGGAFS